MSRSNEILLPRQRLENLPKNKLERVRAIVDAFKADGKLYNAMHWLFGGYLFMIDAEGLHTELGHETFHDWLKDNADWLPIGTAQAYKLKRMFSIFIHEYQLHTTATGAILQRIDNIDRLDRIASFVTSDTVHAWVAYVEHAHLNEVEAIRKKLNRLLDDGYTLEELTPKTVNQYEQPDPEPIPEPVPPEPVTIPPMIFSPVKTKRIERVAQRNFWKHVPKPARRSTLIVAEYDDGTVNVTITPE